MEHRLAEARQHQEQDDQPLDDHEAHGVGPGRLGGDAERHEGVEAQAGGQRERVLGEQTHGDGHDTRHQRGASGDRGQIGRVTTTEELPGAILDEAEDDRVQRQDVAHGHEGDHTATDLSPDGRSPLGDLEEAVEY